MLAINMEFSRIRLVTMAILILGLLAPAIARETPAEQKHDTAAKGSRTIQYRNTQYGFIFTLPASWKGYRALWSDWEGNVRASVGSLSHTLHGPMLRIRHPHWPTENPREDIPIMIFTVAQWKKHPDVSAAPFDPPELGRNRRYVFAVPPRWDYDKLEEGWEEADAIVNGQPLHTFAPASN